MDIPSFTITHLIVDYLIRLEVALSKINSTPLPKPNIKELQTRVEIDDIQNISELIGNPIGSYKAEQIHKGHIMPTRSSPHLIFINYRNALEFARSYKSTNSIPPSTELILHINKILLKTILESWDTGKIRNFSDKPNEVYDTWYKHRDYYPNIYSDKYFDEVLTWVDEKKYAVHRMIRLAVLLYELMDKAPLFGGNQITTTILLQTLSKEYGYNPHLLFSYSKALNLIADDLESAFKLAKGKRDLTVFIEAFLYTTSHEMINLNNAVEATFDTQIKKGGKLREKFNTRQIRILEYLENVKKVTREEYTKMTGVSFMTSYRDLKHLVDEDYLLVHGTGRGTFYTLNEDLRVPEEKEKRIKVIGE